MTHWQRIFYMIKVQFLALDQNELTSPYINWAWAAGLSIQDFKAICRISTKRKRSTFSASEKWSLLQNCFLLYQWIRFNVTNCTNAIVSLWGHWYLIKGLPLATGQQSRPGSRRAKASWPSLHAVMPTAVACPLSSEISFTKQGQFRTFGGPSDY